MRCINCNNEIPDDVRFCKICGAQQIIPSDIGNNQSVTAQQKHGIPVWGIVIIILLVAALGLDVYFLADKNNDDSEKARSEQRSRDSHNAAISEIVAEIEKNN